MHSVCSLMSFDRIVTNLHGSQDAIPRINMSNFTKNGKSYGSGYEKRMARMNNINRFKKNSNLVETNKTSFQRMASSTVTFDELIGKSLPKNPTKKMFSLTPLNRDSIMGSRVKESPMESTSLSSESLEAILNKNKMKTQRNLLSYNILQLQKKYNLSRFELHSLYSMFHTLLSDAKESINRFKRGFEVIFNMNKIAIRPETLEKIFREQKTIDFESFIGMYSKIDETIYRQNIIDYVQILFEGIENKDRIRFEEIIRIMNNRISEKESTDIAKIIFEEIGRKEELTVQLSEIYDLCHKCQSFAKKMYRLYTRQCKCD